MVICMLGDGYIQPLILWERSLILDLGRRYVTFRISSTIMNGISRHISVAFAIAEKIDLSRYDVPRHGPC